MRQVLWFALAAAVLIGGAGAPVAVRAQAGGGAAQALVNPNTASEAELARLPHMNAALAKALVAKRPFATMTAVDALLTSQGLSKTQTAELYGRMFLPLNLNTASDAEILLIPNLGNRMLHEFKEYRPYKAIEQFRREIGKYVSKEEVARLERYVAVR
jgi:DNA uptake protein ComE-like DNA-binding protein